MLNSTTYMYVLCIVSFERVSLPLSSVCIFLICSLPTTLSILKGIVFNNLQTNSLEYTLRLRHEVGDVNTWNTIEADYSFDSAQEPRFTPK